MASRHKPSVVAIIGLVLSGLSLLCLIISMCTPNWIESQQERLSGFGRLGLWEACFNRYVSNKDTLGKQYNGCHMLVSFEYRAIFTQINPAWLIVVQVLLTLTLVIMCIVVVFVIMYFINCCRYDKVTSYVLASSILSFVSGLLIAVCTIMFGVKADTDRQWLPNPDSNFLSWSFGMAVLSGFFALFAGMCLIVEFLRLRQENLNRVRRQNMALTTKPTSRY